MLAAKKAGPNLDAGKALHAIEKSIYAIMKPYGFKKYGRTVHRFVSEDISQVVNFQLGQAYRAETHLLFVNVGIRIPECMTRRFTAEETPKKYYHEYECNIRSRLGTIEGKKESCYDLRQSTDEIIADIARQIQTLVLPAFEQLNSRNSILDRRRDYPQFDLLNRHLILLEEAMIYGRYGEREKAEALFNLYYRLYESGQLAQKDRKAIQGHLQYLDRLAAELGIPIK